jgi:anti-sigma B factor antagonist
MLRVQLNTRECDGYVVAALHGELDMVDAAAVADGLCGLAAGRPAVIADLRHLTFIDCSGLNALLGVLKQVQRAGGDLLLAGPRQQARRALTITRLISVFSVYASVEEAIAGAERARRAAAPVPYP